MASSKARLLSQRMSPNERQLQGWLQSRGLMPVPQQAVGRYNVDLGLAPLAVEVHNFSWRPFRDRRLRKRADELRDRGWAVLYVWAGKSFPLIEALADEIVAYLQLIRADPAARREHRVIRSKHQTGRAFGYKGDDVTVVPAAKPLDGIV